MPTPSGGVWRRVVDEAVRASRGAAARAGPPLFALAMAASFGDDTTRSYALSALRTGSQLFRFVEYADGMRGWGKGLRQAVGGWYQAQRSVRPAAYQVVKNRQRNGWTHRDLPRKAHPPVVDIPDFNALFGWVTQGAAAAADDPRYDIIRRRAGAGQCRRSGRGSGCHPAVWADPWEMAPVEALSDRRVWEALFEAMPLTALLRNLATLTRLGVIAPMSEGARRAAGRLTDTGELAGARIHPIAILAALTATGPGLRGQHAWLPAPAVADALDAAFGKSFAYAPQTGRRFYPGIDVSGSMGWRTAAGVAGLTPRMGAAAMAMAIARRESGYHMAAFADGRAYDGKGSADGKARRIRFSRRRDYEMMPPDISATNSIAEALRKTDGLPMRDALRRRLPADCFVVITDNETWAGDIHPVEALRQYREGIGMGIAAKLVAVAMTSTGGFSIADPEDGGMLAVVGFDAAGPQVVADFVGSQQGSG